MPIVTDIIIEEFKDISYKYDAFIIDLWGVIHDGFKGYPGAVECINKLIATNKPIIFMSNAPRPNIIVLKKLLELKINATQDMILTSGDVTRIFLAKELIDAPYKKYFHLGAHRNSDLLMKLNINLTNDFDQCDTILLTAYLDEDEDLKQFDYILQQAVALQIPIICSNPDKIVVNGHKNRYCAGFLAQKYEELGGTVIYHGKPHLSIYTTALEDLKLKEINDRNRILMIGDTIETDIQGAINSGISSALVLTGNTHNLLKEYRDHHLTPNQALNQIFNQYKIFPTHVINSLHI